jgi:hypothetical protein
MRFYDAMGRINQVSPVEMWPSDILDLMKNGLTLTIGERTKLVCFLFGNGSNADDIRVMLHHKLRDESARVHVKTLLQDVLLDTKKQQLYYFDVDAGDYLYMAGTPKGPAYGSRLQTRMINSWDAFVNSHGSATYAMQEAFFGQTEITDAELFFNLMFARV